MQSGKIQVISRIIQIGFLIIQVSVLGCTTTNASDLIREKRIIESPQWNGETFQNPERVPDVEWGPSLKMFWDYFFNKSEGFIPDPPLPAEPFDISQWNGQRDLQFAWLGHTTFLIKIDDKVVLSDPMFSQRAGSFGWVSPRAVTQSRVSGDKTDKVDFE